MIQIIEHSQHDTLDLEGIDITDGSPVLVYKNGKQYIYINGLRYCTVSPDYYHANGMGIFAYDIGNSTITQEFTNLNNYKRLDSEGRIRRVNRPLAYFNQSGLDSLSHIDSVFDITTNESTSGYSGYSGNSGSSGYSEYEDVTRTYGIIQAEDRFDEDHEYYGNISMTRLPCYGRICIVEIPHPYRFIRLGTNYRSDLGVTEEEWTKITSNRLTPLLEHWQPETVCLERGLSTHPITGNPIPIQEPYGLRGVAASGSIIIGDYLYVMYTRVIDTRNQNYIPNLSYPGYGYPQSINQIVLPDYFPPDPEQQDAFKIEFKKYFARTTMCIARAKLSDINRKSIASKIPFQKYYKSRKIINGRCSGNSAYDSSKKNWYWAEEPDWDIQWTSGFRGLDTSIMSEHNIFGYGSVSWNSYLNRFVYVTQNVNFDGVKVLYSDEGYNSENLLKWHDSGIALVNSYSPVYYPRLINEEGTSVNLTGKVNWLYFITKNVDNRFITNRIRMEF